MYKYLIYIIKSVGIKGVSQRWNLIINILALLHYFGLVKPQNPQAYWLNDKDVELKAKALLNERDIELVNDHQVVFK